MERRISAKVKDGVIVVDPAEDVAIAEGAEVIVLVDEERLRMPGGVRIDENGDVVLTAEQEAELAESIAEADRSEGVPWAVVREEIRRKYGH